jgi:hypothetical protein
MYSAVLNLQRPCMLDCPARMYTFNGLPWTSPASSPDTHATTAVISDLFT